MSLPAFVAIHTLLSGSQRARVHCGPSHDAHVAEIHDVIRDHVDSDACAFAVLRGSAKVEVFEISRHDLATGSEQDIVDEDFGSGEVGNSSANIARVVNLITSASPARMMKIFPFWAGG